MPSGLGLGDMPRALRTATIYPKHNLELNVLDLGDIRPQRVIRSVAKLTSTCLYVIASLSKAMIPTDKQVQVTVHC